MTHVRADIRVDHILLDVDVVFRIDASKERGFDIFLQTRGNNELEVVLFPAD